MNFIAQHWQGEHRQGNHRQGAPKYAIVRDWLAGLIGRGEMPAGTQLPSENDLVRRFGVSRVTVRHALDSLKRSGLVESRQGRGYFVRTVKTDIDLRRLQGLGDMLAAKGARSETRLIERRRIKAMGENRRRFGLAAGAQLTVVQRLGLVGGRPVCTETHYIPGHIADRFSDADFETGDPCTLFERDPGIAISVGDLVMEIVPVAGAVASALGLQSGTPAVRFEQVNFCRSGAAVDYSVRHARAEAFRYTVRVGRG